MLRQHHVSCSLQPLCANSTATITTRHIPRTLMAISVSLASRHLPVHVRLMPIYPSLAPVVPSLPVINVPSSLAARPTACCYRRSQRGHGCILGYIALAPPAQTAFLAHPSPVGEPFAHGAFRDLTDGEPGGWLSCEDRTLQRWWKQRCIGSCLRRRRLYHASRSNSVCFRCYVSSPSVVV